MAEQEEINEQTAAHFRVIYAAPDMLAALRDLVEYAERLVKDGAPTSRAINRARAAIAKATGG